MTSELLVSRIGSRFFAALREDGITVELRVDHARSPLSVGRILKARVAKVLPGIQSAFLDVGEGRDAFLHVSDLVLPGELLEPAASGAEGAGAEGIGEDDAEDDPEILAGRLRAVRRREILRGLPIEQRLREGRELIVQVAREAIGTKGARVSCAISLPGRYLVSMPQVRHRGVSRRIVDVAERERLRAILASLPAAWGGFVVRTAGESSSPEAFVADAERLRRTWSAIEQAAANVAAPASLHDDHDLLIRLLRDVPREGVARIVVDDAQAHARALEYLLRVDPALAPALRLHVDPPTLFDATGVTQDIERALRPKVWLKSGGTLVIQQTEALVSVDVNTGKFVGRRTAGDTVLKTNLEAAVEIARQIRLRDLGGIIVIDFIDMESSESRQSVIATLSEALRRDRARTKIVGLSELGLLQLTRKRTRPGLEALVTRPCPTCLGQGRVKSPETVAGEALVEVRRVHTRLSPGHLTVRVSPDVGPTLRLALQTARSAVDALLAEVVLIEDDDAIAPDAFEVLAR